MAREILATTPRMRACKLWPGSMEHTEYRFIGLSPDTAKRRVEAYKRCDDLTADEIEYCEALIEALDAHEKLLGRAQ